MHIATISGRVRLRLFDRNSTTDNDRQLYARSNASLASPRQRSSRFSIYPFAAAVLILISGCTINRNAGDASAYGNGDAHGGNYIEKHTHINPRYGNVDLFNPYAIPVMAAVAGIRVPLGPGGMNSINLPEGDYRVYYYDMYGRFLGTQPVAVESSASRRESEREHYEPRQHNEESDE